MGGAEGVGVRGPGRSEWRGDADTGVPDKLEHLIDDTPLNAALGRFARLSLRP